MWVQASPWNHQARESTRDLATITRTGPRWSALPLSLELAVQEDMPEQDSRLSAWVRQLRSVFQ